MNSVVSLPPETHMPEKSKEDEILDPKQRKVIYNMFHYVAAALVRSDIFC